ncbi:hypothetical protein [Nocardia inohanensis]|uniref:hypothetical protein n=1 Tax=Nocardia inohanensis TaxID=209246 RepID=UPI0012F9A6F4|nr:hypothetical protein [Nocardia inohanensis]
MAARAEVVKLARELHTAPEDLAFLLESDPQALRQVRRGMHKGLDAEHRPMFDRLAKTSALIPNPLAVTIATRFFGPVLCGMIAPSLSPERAQALIGHVPMRFLADLAPHVDPDAATPIIRSLDTEVMVPVMREMLRRKDYVTLARFLVAATDRQLLEVLPHLDSGEDMLLVAFNAELDAVSDRFEVVMAALPEERIREVLLAGYEQDRVVEALTFMQFLSTETLARVGNTLAEMDDEILTHMVETAHRESAWAELIPIATAMSEQNQLRMAELEVWDDEKIEAITRVAEQHGLAGELGKMIIAAAERRD